jgi:hypothetical protein
MILADVVKLSKSPSQKIPSGLRSDYQSLVDQKNRVFDALSKTYGAIDTIEQKNRKNIEKNQFLHNRIDFFYKMGTLPSDLQLDKNDPLSLASKSPRIDLKELRETAETLDFVLIPFEYMTKAAYEGESKSTKNSIEKFNEEMSRIGSVYTLCPSNCYDLYKHVLAKKDLPVFSSSKNQFLQAVTTLVPIHRVTFSAINALQEKTEKIATTFETQMNSMSKEFTNRIDEITSQNRLRLAERIQQRELNSQVNTKKAGQELQKLAEQIKVFIPADPLMFMVPKDINILSDNASCVVGPCWGPDFDDIVFSILGFKKVEGQRELIMKESQKWNF